jgi:ATP-dependent Clp protease ATP-binding subunit ClpC
MNWFEWAEQHLANWKKSSSTDGRATPRAKQILDFARLEATRLNHNFVGTEHLLLGILKLGQGVAVNVIKKACSDLDAIRAEIEKRCPPGPTQLVFDRIPYTPRSKTALTLAQKESEAMQHTHIGTEHILLGLLREKEGVAGKVLLGRNLTLDRAREEVLKELDTHFHADTPPPENPPNPQP